MYVRHIYDRPSPAKNDIQCVHKVPPGFHDDKTFLKKKNELDTSTILWLVVKLSEF